MSNGATSLLSDNNKGRTAFLSSEQLEAIENHISQNVYPYSKGIVVWIKNEFGITYNASGITSLLKRLGFVYKKPVLTPCNLSST